ncbi:MAG: YbhB/YbcL family Raf kinase inhibitor-like protein [Minisyncoccia bacterium]
MKNAVLTGIGVIALVVGGWFFLTQNSATTTQNQEIVRVTTPSAPQRLTLASTDFPAGGSIPSKFTCDGLEEAPRLSVAGIPEATKSLVLIMDDPDIPDFYKKKNGVNAFDHWILFNISPETTEISETTEGIAGPNGLGRNEYMGPCPPREFEPADHAYSFRLYALDTLLSLGEGATKQEIEKAMEGHIIVETKVIGRYKRP